MPDCTCHRCIDANKLTDQGLPLYFARMIVCGICGNKRCPKADDHRMKCTGSNRPGQEGERDDE